MRNAGWCGDSNSEYLEWTLSNLEFRVFTVLAFHLSHSFNSPSNGDDCCCAVWVCDGIWENELFIVVGKGCYAQLQPAWTVITSGQLVCSQAGTENWEHAAAVANCYSSEHVPVSPPRCLELTTASHTLSWSHLQHLASKMQDAVHQMSSVATISI